MGVAHRFIFFLVVDIRLTLWASFLPSPPYLHLNLKLARDWRGCTGVTRI
jgi:hypothetical protein